MTDQLNKLREIMSGNAPKAAERLDPRDAVGLGEIEKSERWLADNKHLPKSALWSGWKTEIGAFKTITPNNKDYFWETEFKLHPKGPKAALADYERMVENKLATLTDDRKEYFLRDIAREAPPNVTNNLLIKLGVVSQKIKGKTEERARIDNILEFQNMAQDLTNQILSGELSSLNPEVSIHSHADDLLKMYMSHQSQYLVDNEGRIAVGTDEGVLPVWSLQSPDLPWEEQAIMYNDLTNVAKKAIEPLIAKSRLEAAESDYKTTRELFNKVSTLPREFRSSIIIDGAVSDRDPMTSTRMAIDSILSSEIEKNIYPSQQSITRAFFAEWKNLFNTLEKRASDGTVE